MDKVQSHLLDQVDISIYRKIVDVPSLVWNSPIKNQNKLLEFKYLRLIEELHQSQLSFYYCVCFHQDEFVGFYFFQENTFHGKNLMDYFPSTTTGPFLKRVGANFVGLFKPIVNSLHLPMLNAGNVFMTGEAGCYCNLSITPITRCKLQLKCIEEILLQYPHIKAVLNADFYENQAAIGAYYLAKNYNYIDIEADNIMQLQPSWHTFDDYISALSSKYRVRAKKILKLSDEVKRRVLSLEDVKSQQSDINFLYHQVADKVSFKLATLHPDFFYEQKKSMLENYLIEGYYLGDKMIGFISIYLLDTSAEVHYFGIDYSMLKDYHLYQRMLYDVVDISILAKKEKIHFGRTAPEVKTTIGAVVHPMFGYLKHRNAIINFVMGFFTKRMKPPQYTLRNPFKS